MKDTFKKEVNGEFLEREDLIFGRNAVIEALKSSVNVEELLLLKGPREGSINVILSLCKENNVIVKEVNKKRLDILSNNGNHQGVILKITPYKYFELEDLLKHDEELNENQFILILDKIKDVHNFGALIRSAECFGINGIVIPKRRSVSVSETVYKVSVGAAQHMKIAKVTNISDTIDFLKERGFWIYGGDMYGEIIKNEGDYGKKIALVIGSEDEGISNLVKKKCDVLLKIPMKGKINSLNASVAGGILMYELSRSRNGLK